MAWRSGPYSPATPPAQAPGAAPKSRAEPRRSGHASPPARRYRQPQYARPRRHRPSHRSAQNDQTMPSSAGAIGCHLLGSSKSRRFRPAICRATLKNRATTNPPRAYKNRPTGSRCANADSPRAGAWRPDCRWPTCQICGPQNCATSASAWPGRHTPPTPPRARPPSATRAPSHPGAASPPASDTASGANETNAAAHRAAPAAPASCATGTLRPAHSARRLRWRAPDY